MQAVVSTCDKQLDKFSTLVAMQAIKEWVDFLVEARGLLALAGNSGFEQVE